jgi:BTB/POZ domain-containing protein KCTD9
MMQKFGSKYFWMKKFLFVKKRHCLNIEKIREKAYYLWEHSGKPSGLDNYFWDEAKKIIQKENIDLCPKFKIKYLLEYLPNILSALAIIIGLISYLWNQENFRNSEVFSAWQTINAANGQTGSGGRIKALEYLNKEQCRFPFFFFCSHPEKLSYLEVPRASLSKIKLDNAKIDHSNLSFSTLDEASFIKANISESNLNNTQIHNAKMNTVNLTESTLYDSNLENTEINNSILKNSHFDRASLTNVFLDSSDLSQATFISSEIRGSHFKKAVLEFANFEKSNLYNSDFSETKLYGVSFRDATLHTVNFKGAVTYKVDKYGNPLLNEDGTHIYDSFPVKEIEVAAQLCNIILPNGHTYIPKSKHKTKFC